MNPSEHDKAILAIEALAHRIGQRGEETEDQGLLIIASNLQLFMISAMSGDLGDFLNYVNDFREKKINEMEEELKYLLREQMTGKKVSTIEKIARKSLTTNN
jgi:hypothetical protein